MVMQGRQCTGANTTPLGALNPAMQGQRPPSAGGSLLMPHLASMMQNQPPYQPPQPAQWQPSQPSQPKQNSPPKEPGSWEPSRMRKKSRERSSRRRRSRSRGRRSRSRSRSRKSRRSRSRSRRSRSRDRKDRKSGRHSKRSESPKSPATDTKATEKARKRKSRWGAQDDLEFIPGMPVTLPPNLSDEQQRLYLIHVKIEEINKKLKTGDFGADDNRSPSPEPVYNSEGKRLNTREFRIRKKLEDERQALIQEAMRLNPQFKPTGGDVQQIRHQEKVMIPVLQNPNVNFMGLLIGPRGNSLKKLEDETGTKIMIRGKGSVKEGKGRKDGLPMPGEDEDLHALISAPSEEGLHGAIRRITQIINDAIASPENTNELKKTQMRELALLNGTLRDEDLLKCRNCGALDHRDWECQAEKNVTQMVTCSRCGGGGHLASDCQVDLTNTNTFIPDKAKMDSEYMSLMAELGVAEDGAGVGATSSAGTTAGFNPRQSNVMGGGVRPKHPGLGSDFTSNNNNMNPTPNPNFNNNRGGFSHQRMPGSMQSRGNFTPRASPGERPSWQNNNSRGGYQGSRGGYQGRGGYTPRGAAPRAPWQNDNNSYGGPRPPYAPRGGYGGFPPQGPPGVNIPTSKPPPPPEEPSDTSNAPWNDTSNTTNSMSSWGMMPPVMPPWMTGMPGVQIPSIPPAPPSVPPPPPPE